MLSSKLCSSLNTRSNSETKFKTLSNKWTYLTVSVFLSPLAVLKNESHSLRDLYPFTSLVFSFITVENIVSILFRRNAYFWVKSLWISSNSASSHFKFKSFCFNILCVSSSYYSIDLVIALIASSDSDFKELNSF